MPWNWERPSWPEFTYQSSDLEPLERKFLLSAGEFIGAFKHIGPDDRETLKIELISDEALKTSEIEGEVLDRDSVESSLRRQFGLGNDGQRILPAENGIAEMMADLYKNFDTSLSHETMLAWHSMLMSGSRRIHTIGAYRTHPDPMQVVSGNIGHPKVHFEAPPSSKMTEEMDAFVSWFNETAPGGKHPLAALTRAGLAHLYFVSIHPFEDGNGRIARALAEKSLAQNLAQPTLIALSYTIERSRKEYYAALERNNKDMEIADWLLYFANTVIDAQANTIRRVNFYLAKTKLYEALRDQFNERQEKAIARMFREGIDGFKGGLSAENYISITKTSRATATRDLQDLVNKSALTKTGELRHTRYHLNISVAGE
ncbi:Fic family protein [Bradyrhizobium sp. 186]|uniref:Fic family protein n=1 Tax=Bradyrhizobium sp. 186 TaxID=2782654 RepID=UPI002000F9CB|nr:Fic family protein [Bradyrhizobium sp. 186]UPK33104.1 Fic family protein [Bradyrhizobium sp. 186]